MTENSAQLSHIAGTFLIKADGAFLNGAGIDQAGDDRNVTKPKTFRDGRSEVPYVSAQAWKRWLRTTAIEEGGWLPSEPQAIGWNPKGNPNKIAGELNPVEFPEDDIFGYMRAQAGQGKRKADEDVDAEAEAEEPKQGEDRKVKAVMRGSPFAASLLISLRRTGWRGDDEGFVHLTRYNPSALAEAEVERFLQAVGIGAKERRKDGRDVWKRLSDVDETLGGMARAVAEPSALGVLRERLSAKAGEMGKADVNFIGNATSPVPYRTRFYNTNLQGIFCLDYRRLGVFWNIGDRYELDPDKIKDFLNATKVEDVTDKAPYDTLTQHGRQGRVYRLVNADKARKERAQVLLKALAVLRGGAKQAQFGTDVAPKALLLAGLTCGNPVLNHLFTDDGDGDGVAFKIDTFKEVIRDYATRIATPVLIGIRAGYVANESEVRELAGWYEVLGTQAGPPHPEKPAGATLAGPTEQRPSSRNPAVHVRVMSPVDSAREMGAYLP